MTEEDVTVEVGVRAGCREDFGDRSGAFGPFPEHVFLSRPDVEFEAGYSGAFLAAVVLFLHQEIHLVESPSGVAIFLFIVRGRLEEAYQSNSAFVFQGFQVISCNDLNVNMSSSVFPV